MWDFVMNLRENPDGSFRQNVTWRGAIPGGSPGNYVYSVTITADAKKELDAYFAVERAKGNATNLMGVITTFLKRKSVNDADPPAVHEQTLTADEAREILGLHPKAKES